MADFYSVDITNISIFFIVYVVEEDDGVLELCVSLTSDTQCSLTILTIEAENNSNGKILVKSYKELVYIHDCIFK